MTIVGLSCMLSLPVLAGIAAYFGGFASAAVVVLTILFTVVALADMESSP